MPLLLAAWRVFADVRLRPAVAALAALLCLALLPGAASAAGTAVVQRSLARQFAAAGLSSGAYARDLTSGRELIAVRPDRPRIPASVNKLFVTAASLLRFGPDEQLSTRVVSNGAVGEDGTLDGDVWIVGGGDPALGEDDLRRLAETVVGAGIREVTGHVYGDDTAFDRLRGGPRTNFAPDFDLGGRLGALVLRRGFQPHPTTYVTRRFISHLRAAGVHVSTVPRVGAAPSTYTELGSVGSPAVRDLIRMTNVPSDNFFADMLLKALGATFGPGGSTAGGAAVVRATLDDFGVRPRVVDGSGLARANRTTPRQVVRLLERMEGQDTESSWIGSLAVAGLSGTVHARMRSTPAAGRCHTKTGTIRGVSNLAGVCLTTGGRTVAFAWLMQGVSTYRAHKIQDRMTATLARLG